jgi:hypothetical protein
VAGQDVAEAVALPNLTLLVMQIKLGLVLPGDDAPYMRLPCPRTTNQYDPMMMTRNIPRASTNSIYSVVNVALARKGRTCITAKMTKAMAPVTITGLNTGAPV